MNTRNAPVGRPASNDLRAPVGRRGDRCAPPLAAANKTSEKVVGIPAPAEQAKTPRPLPERRSYLPIKAAPAKRRADQN